jgi:hypothetical protein
MNMQKNNKTLILAAGETLSQEWQDKIKEMNAGKPDFQTYSRRVRDVFNLDKITINEKKSYFLAGFIEGEGSISVGAKKNHNSKFGVEIDPLFNITQHINGVNHLYLALETFKTGRIRYKAGSNATLVFTIEPRKSLTEKVCPYFEKYVYPLSSPAKQIRFNNFKKLLALFDENAHLDRTRIIIEVLPIWDLMRMQQGYTGQTFKSLEEAQEFVRNFI